MAYRRNKSVIGARNLLRSKIFRQFSVACIFILLAFLACDKSVEPKSSEARIVIDESIDGVRIGDDSLAVVQKLGPPSSIVAPRSRGWALGYDSGTHAGMGLLISNYGRSSQLLVTSMSVSPPYTGKTSDGIGIGVDQAFVVSRLGNPTDTLPTMSGLLVRYAYSSTNFEVGYTNDTVSTLAIVANY